MSSSVGSQSFIQYYAAYCKEKNVRPKVHLLANNTLKINADCLVSDEWNPIIKALKSSSTDLHQIIISSKYLIQRNQSRPRNKLLQEPDFLKESLFKSLIVAIGVCISNTDILSSVVLEGFPLEGNVGILNASLNKQKFLQHLSIPNCVLREEDVESVCKTVTLHTGLRTIDLTGCGITINGAKNIAAMIRSQKLVRYGETWKQSLRYRNPKPDVVPGIRRITLNNNVAIGDEGFKIVCYEMIDDLWLKALDFQNCGITDASSDFALHIIKTNSYLKILDLRMNYISSYITKYISELLQKCPDDSDYDWLSTTNPTRSTIVTDKVKNNNSNRERTGSALSHKTQNINKMPLPVNKECEKSSTKDSHPTENELYALNFTTDNKKINTNGISGELERTKNILHKVSCRLFEERNKRESIEKQHKQCKDQLEKIRNCLEQHINKTLAQESKSNMKTQTYNQSKKIVSHNTKVTKKNSENVRKGNRTNSKTSIKTDYNKIKSRKQSQLDIIQSWTNTLKKNAISI